MTASSEGMAPGSPVRFRHDESLPLHHHLTSLKCFLILSGKMTLESDSPLATHKTYVLVATAEHALQTRCSSISGSVAQVSY